MNKSALVSSHTNKQVRTVKKAESEGTRHWTAAEFHAEPQTILTASTLLKVTGRNLWVANPQDNAELDGLLSNPETVLGTSYIDVDASKSLQAFHTEYGGLALTMDGLQVFATWTTVLRIANTWTISDLRLSEAQRRVLLALFNKNNLVYYFASKKWVITTGRRAGRTTSVQTIKSLMDRGLIALEKDIEGYVNTEVNPITEKGIAALDLPI